MDPVSAALSQNLRRIFVAILFLTHLVAVFPVPLVEQMHVVAHLHQRLPQQLQLGRVDLRWYWTIAVP